MSGLIGIWYFTFIDTKYIVIRSEYLKTFIQYSTLIKYHKTTSVPI